MILMLTVVHKIRITGLILWLDKEVEDDVKKASTFLLNVL